MELDRWFSLFGICLLGAMSPGPSLAVVLNAALGEGRRAGYSAAIAHGAAVGLYGLLTVAGLAVVIARSPALFNTLQIAGACYLLYLGIGILRHACAAKPVADSDPGGHSWALGGFLVACLNPKLAVFMLALFAQFLNPGDGPREKAIMALTVGLTDACWYALVVSLVSHHSLSRRLRRGGALIDRLFGCFLVLIGATVLLRAVL